jgi:hypothetical protein
MNSICIYQHRSISEGMLKEKDEHKIQKNNYYLSGDSEIKLRKNGAKFQFCE